MIILLFLLAALIAGLHYVNVFVMMFAPADRAFVLIGVCVVFFSIVGSLTDSREN
jgi:hypothetical protein